MTIVDTCVWSLSFRRRQVQPGPATEALARILEADEAIMLGCVRQELLSGIRDTLRFDIVKEQLRIFDDFVVSREDYERAAEFDCKCRKAGIAASSVDMLICAVAYRYDLPVLTTDEDFRRYAEILGIRLHPLP